MFKTAQRYHVAYKVNDVAFSSFSLQFGARPIKRFIQNNIETLIAREIVEGRVNTTDKYVVDYKDNQVTISKK